mmetsp:Transcript_92761/g.276691  ORF Transcript_92761/g.276691 Transcript_92761/m.276691 type:complete len:448 (-) Transcript_92761:140-1483(-)
MYSDDAYNKDIGSHTGQGTLVGNWYEERCLREAVGEGRSVPQRHIPRSGLLQDFSKTPQNGPRKADNTFERVTGPKATYSDHAPASRVIGQHDQETIDHVGPLKRGLRQDWHEAAEAEVQHEEAIHAMKDQVRHFETTHGVTYTKPDDSKTERAKFLSKSCHKELRHGPSPDRTLALGNEAMNFDSHTHYSNIEGVTVHRVALDDPVSRNDLKVSAAGGVRTWGKNSEFSKPVAEFTSGLAKDEELASMYAGLKGTQPLRNLKGGQPRAGAFATVPSLASLKGIIHRKISEVWGAHGYVVLRQKLFDYGDHEGFVSKADVTEVLRGQLGLLEDEAPTEMLDAYLSQQVTMRKTDMKIGTFLASLRPVLPPRERRSVIEAFRALESGGSVRLGDWLSRLGDPELRSTLAAAFGAQMEEHVADMPITEPVFMEVLSDLAPFMDIEPLLQ